MGQKFALLYYSVKIIFLIKISLVKVTLIRFDLPSLEILKTVIIMTVEVNLSSGNDLEVKSIKLVSKFRMRAFSAPF